MAVLWPCCVVMTSKWGSQASWSSSPPYSHLVSVFISRKRWRQTEGKGRHRGQWGERGRGVRGSAGEAGGGGPSSVATSSCGSHSLSAPIPDRWREGESWCQEAVTAGGQSWGEAALWLGFVWGGGSSWWPGCWASLEPAPQEL